MNLLEYFQLCILCVISLTLMKVIVNQREPFDNNYFNIWNTIY